MFIRGAHVLQGKQLSVTTSNQQEDVVQNAEYIISNPDYSETVFVNTDGNTADVTKDMPIFPLEHAIVRAKLGTINYIGSDSLTVHLNKIETGA